MTDLAGLALSVTAVGLWIVAVDARAPRPWRLLGRPWWPPTARVLGLVAGLAAARVFAGAYGAVSGSLVAASAVTGTASIVIVALPVLPRSTWLVLSLAPVAAGLAIALGGLDG